MTFRTFLSLLLVLVIGWSCALAQPPVASQPAVPPPATQGDAIALPELLGVEPFQASEPFLLQEDQEPSPPPHGLPYLHPVEETVTHLPGIEEESLGSPLPEPRGDEWVLRARTHMAHEEWSEAEFAYRKGLDDLSSDDPLFEQAIDELARLLDRQARFFAVLDLLDRLEGVPPVRLLILRATALEALASPLEATQVYLQALQATTDDVEVDEVTARLRHVIDRMDETDLLTFSGLDPFSAEGGYAALQLARLRMGEGRLDEAEPVLARIDFAFTGDPMGQAAQGLLRRIEAMRTVRPGHVGLLLPLTGPLAAFGKGALRGGLLGSQLFSGSGEPITLHIMDSEGSPLVAAQAVEELAMRGVVGIVGPLKGDAARAAAKVARSYGVPLLTLTPADGVAGDGVFRLYLREEDEIEQLVEYAVNVLGLHRFALVVPDTPMGRRYRMLFWDAAVARGAEIAGTATFPSDQTNLKTPLGIVTGIHGLSRTELRERFDANRLQQLNEEVALLMALGIGASGAELALEDEEEAFADFEPEPEVDFDAVFLPVSSLSAAQMAPQLPYYDVTGTTLLGIRSWNYATLTKVGKEYVERAHFPAEWHGQTEAGRLFLDEFTATYEQLPGVLQAYAFDAVQLMVAAHRAGRADQRETLGTYLARLWSKDAVTGPLTTHPSGDIAATPKLLQVHKRQIKPIAPVTPETGKEQF
jgi:ABC-type branched-subunit amino acid transport system substrate-binding protein